MELDDDGDGGAGAGCEWKLDILYLYIIYIVEHVDERENDEVKVVIRADVVVQPISIQTGPVPGLHLMPHGQIRSFPQPKTQDGPFCKRDKRVVGWVVLGEKEIDCVLCYCECVARECTGTGLGAAVGVRTNCSLYLQRHSHPGFISIHTVDRLNGAAK